MEDRSKEVVKDDKSETGVGPPTVTLVPVSGHKSRPFYKKRCHQFVRLLHVFGGIAPGMYKVYAVEPCRSQCGAVTIRTS